MRHSTFKGEVDIDYALIKAATPSDVLVISFPGRGETDKPDRFIINNMVTLGGFNVNALYVSISGSRKKFIAAGLVGFEGDLSIERTMMELVKFACQETGATRCICVGSSLGGNSALYYGLKYNWDIIAGGAAAYPHRGIVGTLIRNMIPAAKDKGFDKSVHMCWGEGEPRWLKHELAPSLVKLFDESGINHTVELFKYSSHGNVHKIFPAVIKQRLAALLGVESAVGQKKSEATEIEITTTINASLKELMAHVPELEQAAPNLAIRNRRNRGELRADRILRTFVYAAQGYHWLPKERTSTHHKPGRFWQTVAPKNGQYAYSMWFQATVLNHYKATGEIAALKLVADSLAEFFPLASLLREADGRKRGYNRWATAWARAECLIDFACTVREQNADPSLTEKIAWDSLQTDIIEALKLCLRTELVPANVVAGYDRLHFLLLAASFFKESEVFCREAYARVMAATLAMINYQFDENGVCIIGQVRAQHFLSSRVRQILEFAEANNFELSQDFNKVKRKLAAIETVAAHFVSPDGFMPNIGHTDLIKTSMPPADGNFIKTSSNIAVLSSGGAYITIGGGSNTRAVHRHCDLLSFTFRYDGRQLVWDAGGGTGGLMDYARSAVAHSALLCDEIDYRTPNYSDWTALEDAVETDQYVTVSGQHVLIDGVTLKRKWLWLKPNIIVVCDEGKSEREHLYTQNFLFPNVKVDDGNESRMVFDMGQGFSFSVTQLPPEGGSLPLPKQSGRKSKQSLAQPLTNGGFKLNRYFGSNKAAAPDGKLRGSQVVEFDHCAKLVNLAYEKRATQAKFVTVLEVHSGKEGELTFGGARIENEMLVFTATVGEKTIEVSESMKIENAEDRE